MIIPIYVLLQPGADRPYVSTSMPNEYLQEKPGTKLFCILAELPGFNKVDSVLKAVAVELPLSPNKKHV